MCIGKLIGWLIALVFIKGDMLTVSVGVQL